MTIDRNQCCCLFGGKDLVVETKLRQSFRIVKGLLESKIDEPLILKQHPEALMMRPEALMMRPKAKLLWKQWCSEAIELLGSEVVRERCCLEAIEIAAEADCDARKRLICCGS